MSKDFSHLRHWLMGWPGTDTSLHEPRPVILECIVSRSGMSMTVYDRGERIFTVNGCGFDRIGTALGEFLERLFQPELSNAFDDGLILVRGVQGKRVYLDGACGFESMQSVAEAINLKVTRSESKAGTLIVIERKG